MSASHFLSSIHVDYSHLGCNQCSFFFFTVCCLSVLFSLPILTPDNNAAFSTTQLPLTGYFLSFLVKMSWKSQISSLDHLWSVLRSGAPNRLSNPGYRIFARARLRWFLLAAERQIHRDTSSEVSKYIYFPRLRRDIKFRCGDSSGEVTERISHATAAYLWKTNICACCEHHAADIVFTEVR